MECARQLTEQLEVTIGVMFESTQLTQTKDHIAITVNRLLQCFRGMTIGIYKCAA